MLVDWFTVAAQTVNFLILVWLLKRFLYKPILDAIDKREQRIADELADADAKKREAKQERDEFTKKNEAFDQHRNELLTKATEDVKAQRQRMLDEARSDTDALRTKRQESLKRELTSLQAEINRRTQAEVFAIARHALSDLADADLEGRICDVFLARLESLDDGVKHKVAEIQVSHSDPAIVRSALELTAQQHDAIQRKLNEVFSTEMPVRFDTDAELASGIELTIGGQRIAWSIRDYLDTLQKRVGELLDDDSAQTADVQAGIAP
ncbi:ATP synthase subunit b, sodium ion specific [Novipirellula galeiformis]|uniref:ATP synthase subunit b n=1 Tax=Novipirellula galeiformis TaxID=2528004 RepID=A0A5C6C8D9_9BACT|nr:F0F1 ATP synthase subunit delta [Novipirellula galeiformis]TWU20933.1 ATP synthase subunit b, sodium ion specific [Novipirellula galeiformis]